MNTKILMTVSVIFLGASGLLLLFIPNEFSRIFGVSLTGPLFAQILGALYLASALTNWTAKDSAIGGVYGRPTSLGNFSHFMIGTLTLAKHQLAGGSFATLVALAIYAAFALAFGWLAFAASGLNRTKKVP